MQDDEVTIILTPPTGTFIYNYTVSALSMPSYLLHCICSTDCLLTLSAAIRLPLLNLSAKLFSTVKLLTTLIIQTILLTDSI